MNLLLLDPKILEKDENNKRLSNLRDKKRIFMNVQKSCLRLRKMTSQAVTSFVMTLFLSSAHYKGYKFYIRGNRLHFNAFLHMLNSRLLSEERHNIVPNQNHN